MTKRIGTYIPLERRDGEVLAGYYTEQAAQFLPFKSKRVGLPTEDGLGEAANPHGSDKNDAITYPVFVSEKEAIERGLIPPPTKQ